MLQSKDMRPLRQYVSLDISYIGEDRKLGTLTAISLQKSTPLYHIRILLANTTFVLFVLTNNQLTTISISNNYCGMQTNPVSGCCLWRLGDVCFLEQQFTCNVRSCFVPEPAKVVDCKLNKNQQWRYTILKSGSETRSLSWPENPHFNGWIKKFRCRKSTWQEIHNGRVKLLQFHCGIGEKINGIVILINC